MRREVGTDDLLPPAKRTTNGGALSPSLVGKEPVNGRAQGLRVIPALARHTAQPFWLC
jgi:hypothetical protein